MKLFPFLAVFFTGTKVYLWNTQTNEILEGHNYPVTSTRDDSESIVWTNDTLIFGGGRNTDNVLYKYSIRDGFVPFSTHGGTGQRQLFVMISAPSNEFSCPSKNELLAYDKKMLKIKV
jgi:hypothetical protein